MAYSLNIISTYTQVSTGKKKKFWSVQIARIKQNGVIAHFIRLDVSKLCVKQAVFFASAFLDTSANMCVNRQ